MNKNKGFTLVELMIVIAIISIMATMSLPSLQDRVIRAQVEEGFLVGSVAQRGVDAFYRTEGRMPTNNDEAGIPAADKMIGNYVTSVLVVDGVIDITFGNKINKNARGKVISLRPAIVPDEPMVPIAWLSGYASVPDGMVVQGENKSTILSRLLPVVCRR